MANFGYQNNPNLPRYDYQHNFTQHEVDEFIKCANDPVYFAINYMMIVNVDKGLMHFDMWDFQQDMLKTFHENRFSICKLPRQVGKTTTSVAYLLHYILFNENVKKNRSLISRLFDSVYFLGKQELAFRGHNESEESLNKGNYRELLQHMAKGEPFIDFHLTHATIFQGTSSDIQNELIEILSANIDLHIRNELSETSFVSIQADDTTDVSCRSQLKLF